MALTTNLELASAALSAMRQYGTAELNYLTAEFEPFSSAQKPDLVFWPASGSCSGRVFVVELRLSSNSKRSLPTAENLREHRDFIASDSEVPLCFAFATGDPVSSTLKTLLAHDGIEVFDCVASGEDLALRVLAWSGAHPTK